MRLKMFSSVVAALLIGTQANAAESNLAQVVNSETVMLPMPGLVVGARKGQNAIFSPNGRYEVRGYVYDHWTGTKITTVEQARHSVNNIDLAKLKLDMRDLGAVEMGSGDKRVPLFLDPYCKPCLEVLRDARALSDQYTFQLLFVPSGNHERSNERVRELHCAADKSGVVDALLNESHLEQSRTCEFEPLMRRMYAAQLLPVDALPFIVSPSGNIARTKPENLEKWLNQEH